MFVAEALSAEDAHLRRSDTFDRGELRHPAADFVNRVEAREAPPHHVQNKSPVRHIQKKGEKEAVLGICDLAPQVNQDTLPLHLAYDRGQEADELTVLTMGQLKQLMKVLPLVRQGGLTITCVPAGLLRLCNQMAECGFNRLEAHLDGAIVNQ